jgi:hypothetical protein
MADNFSVTKDSIQLPYRRFLADSAAGLTLLLIAIGAWYLPIITSDPLRKSWIAYQTAEHLPGVGPQVKVVVLALLFLLATPIGFAVNALSWLLVDFSICVMERRYFIWSRKDGRLFPLWDVTEARFGERLTKYFGLTPENFNVAGWFFRDVLEAYAPDRFESQTHIKGLVVFLRNLTLFALILGFTALAFGIPRSFAPALVLAVIATIFLMVARWAAAGKRFDAKRSTVNGIAIATLVISMIVVVNEAGKLQSIRAAIYFAVAVAVVTIIGAIEYYYHDAILLHAYFVCTEHGIVNPPPARDNTHLLAIGQELIRKIGQKRDD